jgi:hypothetical protein
MAKTLTITGGTLFDVAAQQYGDFTAYWVLLQANGLTDPWLEGTNVLTIPDWSPALSGGVPPQQ